MRTGLPRARRYARSLMPLCSSTPEQGSSSPPCAQGAALALQDTASAWWLRHAGGLLESQRYALHLPSPIACWAKQNSASTSFLTEKTVYISLHFQGYHGKEKCQKVTFFKNESLLYMFSLSKQMQPTPCFERPKV